jgi:hypothetical protein
MNTMENTFQRHRNGEAKSGLLSPERVMGKKPVKVEDSLRLGVRDRTEEEFYCVDHGYLCKISYKETDEGPKKTLTRLANFDVRIKEFLIEDDGGTQNVKRRIEGELLSPRRVPLPEIEVPSRDFQGMRWLSNFDKAGYPLILETGRGVRDLVRHAIETRSRDAPSTTIYTHTGWRRIDNKWHYLTASGAFGRPDIRVEIEDKRYRLPGTMDVEEVMAIRTSLQTLDLGRREVTVPLWLLTYLAPLTTLLPQQPNFVGYLYGETGTRKSTVAILALNHFGDEFSLSRLANFEDTRNRVEKAAYVAKDTLLVLDDYRPAENRRKQHQMEELAQDIIRAYANRTGRGRLDRDLSSRERFVPQGMLIITGEQLVSLPSTLARTTVIEVKEGDIDLLALTELQRKKQLLSYAMLSYILWIKENMDNVVEWFNETFKKVRQAANGFATHGRISEQLSFYLAVARIVGEWIVEKGVMTKAEWENLYREIGETMKRVLGATQKHVQADDPIEQFFEALRTLLEQKKCTIYARDGSGVKGRGDLIGYYDRQYVYLRWSAAWRALQQFCRTENTSFPFKKSAFIDLLKQKNVLLESNHCTKIRGLNVKTYIMARKYLLPDTDEDSSSAFPT